MDRVLECHIWGQVLETLVMYVTASLSGWAATGLQDACHLGGCGRLGVLFCFAQGSNPRCSSFLVFFLSFFFFSSIILSLLCSLIPCLH